MATQMQLKVILVGNRIATQESIKTKMEGGKFFCICVTSAILEYRARERQRKRESGWQASEAQPEKELVREIKNKGDIFWWKNNMKIL